MKLYVASSWRCERQPSIITALRKANHTVYDFRNPPSRAGFGWEQLPFDMHKTTSYLEGLQHPIAKAGYKSDFNAMKDADACVLVLPCGRSAHLEAGWFAGTGKPLHILLEEPIVEPELMYLMATTIRITIDEIIYDLAYG
jgi:hypothetical protein